MSYTERMIETKEKTKALVPTNATVADMVKKVLTGFPGATQDNYGGTICGLAKDRYLFLAGTAKGNAELAGVVAAEYFPEAIERLNISPQGLWIILEAIRDDDREILNDLPIPTLAGEWSDDPTPETLRLQIFATQYEWDKAGPALMDEWEYYAETEYLATLEAIITHFLEKEAGGIANMTVDAAEEFYEYLRNLDPT